MSTLIIVDLTPTDTEKLGAYSAQAAETLKPYGGEFLAKGPIESLHGVNETSSTRKRGNYEEPRSLPANDPDTENGSRSGAETTSSTHPHVCRR